MKEEAGPDFRSQDSLSCKKDSQCAPVVSNILEGVCTDTVLTGCLFGDLISYHLAGGSFPVARGTQSFPGKEEQPQGHYLEAGGDGDIFVVCCL